MSANAQVHGIEDNHDDHGHHKQTFVTKYIFSIDHKMISKQYMITETHPEGGGTSISAGAPPIIHGAVEPPIQS